MPNSPAVAAGVVADATSGAGAAAGTADIGSDDLPSEMIVELHKV